MPPETRPALAVVKVGGSLLADPVRLNSVLAGLVEGACIVVPGGGPFADAVRNAQAVEGFGDAQAHRLALDAMGRMATLFATLEPRLVVASTLDECRRLLRVGRVPVWDPMMLRPGHPDIAESWEVTSDSLALWLARQVGAEACILLKSVAPPPGVSLDDLATLGLVDAAFPDFALRFPGRIEIRGPAVATSRRAA